MYSPDTSCLKEFNKIAVNDFMRIRRFSAIPLDYIIDIGANIGVFTLYSRILFPKSKIISFEPNPASFKCLDKNTNFMNNVFIENVAFGDGKKFKMNSRGSSYLCYYTTESDDGDIVSVNFEQIFNKYSIDINSNYFVKLDCEGSEKYMLNNEYSKLIISKSVIFFMEVHFWTESTPMFDNRWAVYNEWIYDNFSKNHNIEYFCSNKKRGFGHYLIYRNNLI